jgi:6-phosphofructokinase 1
LERTVERGHSVLLVAEGAGQHLFEKQPQERDASGNVKLQDIGLYLKEHITQLFKGKGLEMNLKYIDPSYMIRSVAASPTDRIFCGFLGQNAVHAGMAGKTGMMVSLWNNAFVHVPFELCAGRQKKVDPKGHIWRAVREVTGQGTLRNSN